MFFKRYSNLLITSIFVLLVILNIIVLKQGYGKYKLMVHEYSLINPYLEPLKPLTVAQTSATAYFNTQNIPQPSYLKASHSATLEVLPNHHLIALWFAGSHEAKPDVKIWQSIYSDGVWQMAKPILSHEQMSCALHKTIYKLGNPVVYLSSNGKLNLFVVTVGAIGGWSGSQIGQLVSSDYGKTWQISGILPLTPFLNISNLVRTAPLTLQDGGFYLPAYYEMSATYPIMLRFNRAGVLLNQQRLNHASGMLQPSVVAISPDILYAYLRNMTNKGNGRLYVEVSKDAGITWSKLIPTNLYNHNSSLAVINLGNKQGLLMVHNLGEDRSKLALAYSKNGFIWRNFYYLERNHGYSHEFSYPSIKIDGDTINIVYTWERKAIRYVRFNRIWLEQELAKKESNIKDNES